eukprot:1699114-Pyramimonas_sp.AAC.1
MQAIGLPSTRHSAAAHAHNTAGLMSAQLSWWGHAFVTRFRHTRRGYNAAIILTLRKAMCANMAAMAAFCSSRGRIKCVLVGRAVRGRHPPPVGCGAGPAPPLTAP